MPALACLTFVTLMFMWLKFLVIWRCFRLWALAAGVTPPENMTRYTSRANARPYTRP